MRTNQSQWHRLMTEEFPCVLSSILTVEHFLYNKYIELSEGVEQTSPE